MTVQGMMQQLQSSPHQHACLMGTFGPLEPDEVVEVVEGGIVVGGSGWWAVAEVLGSRFGALRAR